MKYNFYPIRYNIPILVNFQHGSLISCLQHNTHDAMVIGLMMTNGHWWALSSKKIRAKSQIHYINKSIWSMICIRATLCGSSPVLNRSNSTKASDIIWLGFGNLIALLQSFKWNIASLNQPLQSLQRFSLPGTYEARHCLLTSIEWSY